jgi:alkanesulfonate monooxygenase SsuD/methylene tetrahydromethanopterin reductase-like flavin-dependent oxidoreductase (luciferase family)
VEYWLFLPQARLAPDGLVALAQLAERSGYTGVALIDHLVMPLAEHQPLYEAMTSATWVAAHTTTLKISHLVLCDALRHPATLAKQAVTLDHFSGGRFELGIGWGSWPRELSGFGVTDAEPRERAAHLVDSVTQIRRLWAGEPNVEGGLTQSPLPLDRIPLVVGGVGPTALRLAREHADWWNVTAPRIDRLADVRQQVAPARLSVQLMVALDRPGELPGTALARAKGQFPTFPTGIVGGGPARIAEEIAVLDVERVYVWLAPPLDRWAIEEFAGSVMTAARVK